MEIENLLCRSDKSIYRYNLRSARKNSDRGMIEMTPKDQQHENDLVAFYTFQDLKLQVPTALELFSFRVWSIVVYFTSRYFQRGNSLTPHLIRRRKATLLWQVMRARQNIPRLFMLKSPSKPTNQSFNYEKE